MSSREARHIGVGEHAPTVLVIDDHAAVREGLVRLLETSGLPWSRIDAVCGLSEARAACAQQVPDLVILDVDLAGDDGLDLLPTVNRATQVLVLTSHSDRVTSTRALALGAVSLVDKGDPADVLIDAVRAMFPPQLRGDQPPVQVRRCIS